MTASPEHVRQEQDKVHIAGPEHSHPEAYLCSALPGCQPFGSVDQSSVHHLLVLGPGRLNRRSHVVCRRTRLAVLAEVGEACPGFINLP